jgi:hypothetical protein
MVPRIGLMVCCILLSPIDSLAYKCEPVGVAQGLTWIESPVSISPVDAFADPRVLGAGGPSRGLLSPGPMPPENNQAVGHLGTSPGQVSGARSRVYPQRPSAADGARPMFPTHGVRATPDKTRAAGYEPMVAPSVQEASVTTRR